MSIAPHLVVIGIGHVGSDVVTNAAALGLFSRISLIDVDKKRSVTAKLSTTTSHRRRPRHDDHHHGSQL
ncbi:L-lactate dehydrogenase [Cutibacterium acnes JCM 18918]|nr:L-lactate dehydrogenase [Cutibacterium acnes JCM 18918]